MLIDHKYKITYNCSLYSLKTYANHFITVIFLINIFFYCFSWKKWTYEKICKYTFYRQIIRELTMLFCICLRYLLNFLSYASKTTWLPFVVFFNPFEGPGRGHHKTQQKLYFYGTEQNWGLRNGSRLKNEDLPRLLFGNYELFGYSYSGNIFLRALQCNTILILAHKFLSVSNGSAVSMNNSGKCNSVGTPGRVV